MDRLDPINSIWLETFGPRVGATIQTMRFRVGMDPTEVVGTRPAAVKNSEGAVTCVVCYESASDGDGA